MKKFVFCFCFVLVALIGSAKDSAQLFFKTATLSVNDLDDAALGCVIMYVSCECGTRYRTQYCSGGSHGSPEDWVNTVCNQSCGPIDPEENSGGDNGNP